MRYIEVTGKTEDEALKKALAQLNLERDDVSVEILERAKSGFLGIGSSPARLRVTYELDKPDEEPASQSVPEKKPVHAAPAEEKKPAEEKSKDKQAEKKPEEKKPVAEAAKQSAVPAEEAAAQEGTLCDNDDAKRIHEFLSGLLQHLETPAEIKIYETEKDHYKVILEGQKLGALIGRRGETLDAIQQLTNYAVNSGRDKRVRIHVDAENYRAKREQSLESLANKVAGKVLKYRRSVTLEPMNAYERHVIHAALQDRKGVTTYSIGTEPNRRVVVACERNAH